MQKPSQEDAAKPETFADKDEILLGVLSAIEADSHTSQRSISRELGVALGLANAYLKRCVTKGLVKIQQVPQRRYAYYLTPQGFSEKARLTGQYLSASFNFFRRAKDQLSAILAECHGQGIRRIAFAGVSELSDVGILCASDHDVEIVGIVDSQTSVLQYRGLPVVATFSALGSLDAIIVTDLTFPDVTHRAAVAELGGNRVFAPRLLRISMASASEQRILAAE